MYVFMTLIYDLMPWVYVQCVVQVCGNRLLEGGCMTEEKLAKHKDEQVNWTLSFFVVFSFAI